MSDFKDRLEASIEEDRSRDNIVFWANRVIKEKVDISSLLPILQAKPHISFRFMWMLSHVSNTAPELIFPHIAYLFSIKDNMNYPGYKRDITRMMTKCGVPEEIEGEVADCMFSWAMDVDTDIAVKVHSIQTLFDLTKKYPELKEELRLVIEHQMPMGSTGFKNRASKILKKLYRQ